MSSCYSPIRWLCLLSKSHGESKRKELRKLKYPQLWLLLKSCRKFSSNYLSDYERNRLSKRVVARTLRKKCLLNNKFQLKSITTVLKETSIERRNVRWNLIKDQATASDPITVAHITIVVVSLIMRVRDSMLKGEGEARVISSLTAMHNIPSSSSAAPACCRYLPQHARTFLNTRCDWIVVKSPTEPANIYFSCWNELCI